jgi:hypothetical protein
MRGRPRWRLRFEARGDIDAHEIEGAALVVSAEEATSSMIVVDDGRGVCRVAYTMPRSGRYLLHIEHPSGAAVPNTALSSPSAPAGFCASAEGQAMEGEAMAMEPLIGSPYSVEVLPSIDDPSCVVLDLFSGLELARDGASTSASSHEPEPASRARDGARSAVLVAGHPAAHRRPRALGRRGCGIVDPQPGARPLIAVDRS